MIYPLAPRYLVCIASTGAAYLAFYALSLPYNASIVP